MASLIRWRHLLLTTSLFIWSSNARIGQSHRRAKDLRSSPTPPIKREITDATDYQTDAKTESEVSLESSSEDSSAEFNDNATDADDGEVIDLNEEEIPEDDTDDDGYDDGTSEEIEEFEEETYLNEIGMTSHPIIHETEMPIQVTAESTRQDKTKKTEELIKVMTESTTQGETADYTSKIQDPIIHETEMPIQVTTESTRQNETKKTEELMKVMTESTTQGETADYTSKIQDSTDGDDDGNDEGTDGDYHDVDNRVEELNKDLKVYLEAAKLAQNNYDRELDLHASARTELREAKSNSEEEKRLRSATEDQLQLQRAEFASQNSELRENNIKLQSEIDLIRNRCEQSQKENNLLLSQMETLIKSVEKVKESRDVNIGEDDEIDIMKKIFPGLEKL